VSCHGEKGVTCVIGGAQLVAHNASFDVGFLNTELTRVKLPPIEPAIDTFELVRKQLPSRNHSLDGLCDYFQVSRASRTKHGVLLDAQLLAEVYLRLKAPPSQQLFLALDPAPTMAAPRLSVRHEPLTSRLTTKELEAHRAFLRELGAYPIWEEYWDAPAPKTRSLARREPRLRIPMVTRAFPNMIVCRTWLCFPDIDERSWSRLEGRDVRNRPIAEMTGLENCSSGNVCFQIL
jgi:hypothetical protein